MCPRTQMPLYVSLFHVKTLPRPTLLASGHTPLLIAPPEPPPLLPAGGSAMGPGGAAAAPAPGPAAALKSAAVRQVGLFSPDGAEVATAYISCRLTHFGARVPPLTTLALAPRPQQPAARPSAPLPPVTVIPTQLAGVTAVPQGPDAAGRASADGSGAAPLHPQQAARLQQAAALGSTLRPPPPPSLFYANDPLLAQQPQVGDVLVMRG